MASLEEKLQYFERELLDLKTAASLSANVRGYSYRFTLDFSSGWSSNGAYCYEITYGAGDNAIITDWFISGTVWATTPANNKQRLYIYGHDEQPQVFALSTRQIVGAAKINLS